MQKLSLFRSRRGFTLIELLIVIAILALLAVVLGAGLRGCAGQQASKADTEFRQYLSTMYPEYTVKAIAGADRDTDGDGYLSLQARLIDKDGNERIIRAQCASGFWNHGCKEVPVFQDQSPRSRRSE